MAFGKVIGHIGGRLQNTDVFDNIDSLLLHRE